MRKIPYILIGIVLGAGGLYGFVLWTDRSRPMPVDTVEQQTARVGFIGCSNTRQTVYGYRWVGGSQVWRVQRDELHKYDGGAVRNWVETAQTGDSPFWKTFDADLLTHPNVNAVWWQLCIRQDEAEVTREEMQPVITALQKKIPGVTIYVSPLADYTGQVCEITGAEGLARAKSLAEELVAANKNVLLGPILGPLAPREISTEEEDHCHPNEEGMGKMGQQLKDFFDQKLTDGNQPK